MKKKAALLALVFCLLLTILSPGLVQAQGGLSVLNSSAVAVFPSQLSFSLLAQSNVNITAVRLCYRIDQASFAQVTSEVYLEFTPSTKVDVSWSLQMVKIGGLPPGSTVEYWWRVRDASGDRVETAPAQVQFDDTRYSWRNLTEGKVNIYWYKGDDSFARQLMAVAQQALGRLAADTGASLEKPVELYIYADANDLRGAMVYPQEWTGGVAFPRYGIMAIGIAPGEVDWGKAAISHELSHLVTGQMTLNPYNDLPVWLDEGLAMYTEGMLEPIYASLLNKAVAEDSLISVQSLSSPFSAKADEAVLSYAESYSLVEFLITRYGRDKMRELLNTFRQGSSYDGALKKVYGFDMDGLNSLWRDYASKQYQSSAADWMQPALATAGF